MRAGAIRGYCGITSANGPSNRAPSMNDIERCHLVADVIDRVPSLGHGAADTKQVIRDKLNEHQANKAVS